MENYLVKDLCKDYKNKMGNQFGNNAEVIVNGKEPQDFHSGLANDNTELSQVNRLEINFNKRKFTIRVSSKYEGLNGN